MEYRVLGKTGLKVSRVGVGCWQMGGVTAGWTGTTDNESIATIHRAEELGINLLDTARTYGEGRSGSFPCAGVLSVIRAGPRREHG